MQTHLAVDSAKSRRQLYILLDSLCITDLDVKATKLEELKSSFINFFFSLPFPIDNQFSNIARELGTLREKIAQPCSIVLYAPSCYGLCAILLYILLTLEPTNSVM